MRINLELDICEYDTMCDIEQKIIEESAKQMINEVLNNKQEHRGRTFREKLHNEIRELLVGILDTDFKNDIKEGVIEDINKRYIKTKQYKEIKSEFGIESDNLISLGMKDIISDIVRVEIKKMFK